MASAQCMRNEQAEDEEATLNGLLKEAEAQYTTLMRHHHFMETDDEEEVAGLNFSIVRWCAGSNFAVGKIKTQQKHGLVLGTTSVVGAVKKFTNGTLTLHAEKNWGGQFVKSPPPYLTAGTGVFFESTMAKNGCEAAVVYSGKNKAGIQCGWLLAFSNTNAHGTKVYVDCGAISKFNNINWDNVHRNLERSSSKSNHTDYSTGTKVFATIAGGSGHAAVGATFNG